MLKKNIFIILTLLLICSLLISLYQLAYNSRTPDMDSEFSIIKKSGLPSLPTWNNYQNNDRKFKFEYPSNFRKTLDTTDETGYTLNFISDPESKITVNIQKAGLNANMKPIKKLEDFLIMIDPKEKISINGFPAYRFDQNVGGERSDGTIGDIGRTYHLYVLRNGEIITLLGETSLKANEVKDMEKIYSSFGLF